ncbi:MAG TPA: amino acid adenylation domain-containing protein [Thermoanaerobaculia bacterium]|nr:amino acid adenylation domain-containing protein [Thermoanaerobaculia bacterium]
MAIFLDHSFAMVEAVLGVLLSGAAYVPLDPEHPKGRLEFLLADSGVRLTLTTAALSGRLPEGTRIVRLDAQEEEIDRAAAALPDDDPPAAEAAEAVAYVLYTSGSTGQPKGVKVRHRSLVNYVCWAREVYLQGEPLSFALYTSLAFDLTVTSLFTPLVSGGRLYLYPRREGEYPLLDILADDRAEVLKLTPSHLELIRERDNRGSRVRRLIVGGEALSAALAGQVEASFGGRVEIDNEYGPTEATVGCMLHRFGRDDHRRAFVPIGGPAAHVRLYVLDGALQPVAEGLPGELYVGGVCLAEGYLNRDDLTAERFLADPFVAGERVYRTGDRVRRLPGGLLDFLGRADEQVKIRGHRIELGEVRVALNRHRGVRDSVVQVAEGGQGRELVAYYVARTEIDPEELKSSLAESLPEAAIPAFFVHLKRLPLTLNGKVNLQALPTLAEIRRRSRPGFVAPRDAAEVAMAEIWSALLGVALVGAHDNFFQLGGDSIATVRVAARANQAGFQLAPRQIFQFQTLAELTAAIGEPAGIAGIAAIPRRATSGPVPLSFAQERLWFLDQLSPGSPLYNVPLPLRLRGALDAAALAASLQALVGRHEALRTAFTVLEKAEGEPVQVVAPAADRPLPRVDLTGLPADRREPVALGLVREEALRPFDLARGPVLRATLVRLAEADHLLLLTLHHIVADGWSMGVLVREMGELYGAAVAGRPAVMPELPIQYADFALWQREWLAGGALAEQLAWWRERLAGAPAVLDLPIDRPRPPVGSFRGGHLPVHLPAALSRALSTFGRARGATPFMALLAVFSALLSRLSGAADLVVGSPVANRERPEVSGLIGFFVNTLALRGDLSGDPTFGDLLARVRAAAMEALAHQDVPFERLVEELAPERDLRHTPLFQVMLALQNAPVEALELPGLALEPLALESGLAKFDLTVAFAETAAGLAGSFEYATDLFDAVTVERLAERFERLLAGSLERPEARLSELPLLSASEQRQLLATGGAVAGVSSPYPLERTIHDLFREQAERTPEAAALVLGAASLTYRELARRAFRIARFLAGEGIGAGDRVALFLDHSFEMVEAVLGVLLSGAAYVPLDPEHPRGRLDFLLADSGARLAFTSETLAGRLSAGAARIVRLDADRERIERANAGDVELPASDPRGSEAVAYVLYTSLAFDLTVTSLFTPLVTGNRLLIYPRREGEYPLLDILADDRAEVLKLTPSHLKLIQERDNRGSRVRRLIVGGEALSAALARQVEASFGDRVEIYNEYGPTEATVGCMLHRFGADDRRRAFVPIGRPAANVRLYVLDSALQPVAEGLPGELYVGGFCLAEGYLNRDDLTAERFLADPYVSGERVYRTGDRVRRLPGGLLDFLGRADEQVKIRGHRIELGEIRVALNRHPRVRDSVVLVAEEAQGPQLVAFYVARAELDPQALQSALAETLPEAAIPSSFVHLKRMPLTLNGKVNVQALPKLAEIRQGRRAGYVAPRDAAEAAMAAIWSSLLGVALVGAHDNFFQLGGDSIATVRVAARATQAGFRLAPRQIFQFQTLAELTAAIGGLVSAGTGGEGAGAAAPAIPRRAGTGPAPLSFAQERLWFLDQLSPGSPLYNVPLALRLRGALDAGALAASLEALVGRHEALRTRFAVLAEGSPVQWVAPALERVLPQVDLTGLPEDRRETAALGLARQEALRPFDLARGPLLRSTLVRLAESHHLLLLTLHHIVADGWSMGVLVRDMGELYGAVAARRPAVLPELPVQYADFAVWQREWLAAGALAEQLAWWRERLAGAPAELELPVDRPRPAVPSFRGAYLPLQLPAALSRDLSTFGRGRSATPFMVLLAAFTALLSRLAGVADLVVGTPVANRERPEISGLIGFFVNTLPLRGDLSGDPAFGALLARVQAGAMAALAHPDVPFERLVEELAPDRDLRRAQLFQVMLALQNAPVDPLELPGLALEPLALAGETAKFDLTLALGETATGFSGSFEYATDLFDTVTVERLAARFERLLAGALAEPEARLSELPLLSAEERSQLVGAWAVQVSAYPRDATLDGRFAEVAAERADAVALVEGDQQLSYGELAARANLLACRLRELGVAPEVRVGLLLPRSLALVVATLAVLQAGGVYVPLDPSHPAERLAFLLRDTAAPVVVTLTPLLDRLPAISATSGGDAATVLCLDAAAASGPGRAAPASLTAAENLAYVMYTSGSTGVPKGVAVPHRGVVRLVSHTDFVQIGPEDVVSQVANPAFDAVTFEIWGALLNGGRLVVIEPEVVLSPADFAARLAGQSVSVVCLTTALLHQMAREAPGAFRGLRHLLFGGEAGDPAAIARLLAAGPPDRLIHGYGPTESTTLASWYLANRMLHGGSNAAAGPPILPIGRAAANTAVYVLGAHLEPVAAGVPGEICIGGDGLARGYLHRPELTAERFVPAPFGETGGRLYRTGDRARWRLDGEIEFLGRLDAQVKIRGFRIEPGEVEAALLQVDGVAAAVVVVREARGEKLLVAYYAGGPQPAELRVALRAALPEYLMPSAFVPLAALPLTPNGKVDRRALPAVELSRLAGREFVAPRTPLEEQVAEVWKTVLGVERVGVYDSFWELGGHSLLGTRVLARLRDRFGIDLPLRMLFTTPILGELAAAVGQAVLAAQGDAADDLVAELDGLSDDEIRALLAAEEQALEERR